MAGSAGASRLSVPATARKKYPENGVEYHAFPTVSALAEATEEELRGLGLGYRARYIVETAQSVQTGEVSLEKIEGTRYYRRRKEN